MKKFNLSKLVAMLPPKQEKEFTVVFLSKPLKRFGKVTEQRTIVCAADRFEALKIASNRYGKNKIVRIRERTDNIRTDMFKTII